jgi:WD40 repeat protein
LPSGTVLLGGDDYQASAVAFRDHLTVATGDQEGRVSLWYADTGALASSWNAHAGRVNGVACSGDGRILVSAGNDRRVRIWNARTGQEVRALDWDASTVAISPNGRFVVAGSVDGEPRIWDVENGQRWVEKGARPFKIKTGAGVLCAAFSSDSRSLAVGTGFGIILLYDLENQRLQRFFTADHGRVGTPNTVGKGTLSMVYAVAFSPDGRLLATGGKDGCIKLWDTATAQPVTALKDPDNQPIVSLAYSPCTPYLASANWDGKVRIWNVAVWGSAPIAKTIRLPAAGLGQHIEFSPNGRLLASVTGADPGYLLPAP